MSISSSIRTVGPINGDGVATTFPFSFKIFQVSELSLVKTVSGVDTAMTLGVDYSVVLNADQNASPGGTVTYKVASVTTPIPVGTTINGTSNVLNLQPVSLTNNGGFFPKVINDALDRLTILVQQTVRGVNASLKYPLSDGTGIDATLPNKATRLGKVLAFDPTTGVPVASNQTLADIESGSATATAAAATAVAAAGTATTQAGIATTAALMAQGLAGFTYTYSTNTTGADPGSGFLRFNNASLASATSLFISETTGQGQAIQAEILTWFASTNPTHSKLKLVKQTDPTTFAIFDVTGTITDNGTWDTITVAFVAGNGTFSNNDIINVQNSRIGDAGASSTGFFWGGTSSGTNSITVTPSPSLGAYAAGQIVFFKIGGTNTGGATLNVNGLGAINTRKCIGSGLVSLTTGDLQAGALAGFLYDGTVFIMLNPNPYARGVAVASASGVTFNGAIGDYFDVTGTTTINTITLSEGRESTVKFTGALTLTNSASLVLPGGANILTAAGDTAIFRGEASSVVKCIAYTRASGLSVLPPGAVLIKTQTVSGVASVDFVNGSGGVILNSTYSTYIIIGTNILPATDNVNLFMRTSVDGVSYASAGTDYDNNGQSFSGGTATAFGGNASQIIICNTQIGNATNEGVDFYCIFYNPASTTRFKSCIFMSDGLDGSTVHKFNYGGGTRLSTSAVIGLRFLTSSGNISGTISLYGVPA